MARIKDLTAPQLARHAFNVFMLQGRHVVGARLTYHALVLDPREGDALRCLSDLHDTKGTEQLSAVVLEYALSLEGAISDPQRKELDELLFMSKWMWGLSRHESGQTNLGRDDFRDRSRFHVDEAKYQEFLAPVIALGGSLEGAFRGAHTLAGAMGGLLAHQTFGAKAPLEEIFHPERFSRTAAYERWLREKTTDLDALERTRQRLR